MKLRKKDALISLCLFLVAWGAITAKLWYGYKITKKHVPSISFWEYYWSRS